MLGNPLVEVIHLGYLFRLDGGIPQEAIDKRLNSIQAKVNILAATKTTLLARVRIVNSFLLSKLWHSIRLCPVAVSLQRCVSSIINPFLFLGRRNWILHKYAVAPRHLGGLGLIDTSYMSIALIGQIAANLLLSKEPIGFQFRAALQQHLWDEYKAIPAHFMLRRGLPWLAMNNAPLAQRSFLNKVVYALAQLRLSILPDWDNVSVKEMLSLPFHSNIFGYIWPDIHETNTQHWERHGLRVWGTFSGTTTTRRANSCTPIPVQIRTHWYLLLLRESKATMCRQEATQTHTSSSAEPQVGWSKSIGLTCGKLCTPRSARSCLISRSGTGNIQTSPKASRILCHMISRLILTR